MENLPKSRSKRTLVVPRNWFSRRGWCREEEENVPGLEGGVRGEVAGGVLLGGAENAGAPLLVAALGRRPGGARRRRHLETLRGEVSCGARRLVAPASSAPDRGWSVRLRRYSPVQISSKALFPKSFKIFRFPSNRILWHMYGTLNININNN